eukprot:TRINITY_DN2560_c3_g1_i1.p1 TRINITY_DN2560_c3_g1~~TRINITY_DN2560_c3_g1_i1.p1  ORF type:complete len:261 (-),score=43.23 TRINITY_DN2560_c3_g1_i1:40-822(-)
MGSPIAIHPWPLGSSEEQLPVDGDGDHPGQAPSGNGSGSGTPPPTDGSTIAAPTVRTRLWTPADPYMPLDRKRLVLDWETAFSKQNRKLLHLAVRGRVVGESHEGADGEHTGEDNNRPTGDAQANRRSDEQHQHQHQHQQQQQQPAKGTGPGPADPFLRPRVTSVPAKPSSERPYYAEGDITGLPCCESELWQLFDTIDPEGTGFAHHDAVRELVRGYDTMGIEDADALVDGVLLQHGPRLDQRVTFNEFAVIVLKLARR